MVRWRGISHENLKYPWKERCGKWCQDVGIGQNGCTKQLVGFVTMQKWFTWLHEKEEEGWGKEKRERTPEARQQGGARFLQKVRNQQFGEEEEELERDGKPIKRCEEQKKERWSDTLLAPTHCASRCFD